MIDRHLAFRSIATLTLTLFACNDVDDASSASSDALQAAQAKQVAKVAEPAPSPGYCIIRQEKGFEVPRVSPVFSTPVPNDSLSSKYEQMAHLVKYDTKEACEALAKLKGTSDFNREDARKEPSKYINYRFIGGRAEAAYVEWMPDAPYYVITPDLFNYLWPTWIETKDIPAGTILAPYDFKYEASIDDLELPDDCKKENVIACATNDVYDQGQIINGKKWPGGPLACISKKYWAASDFVGKKVGVFCFDATTRGPSRGGEATVKQTMPRTPAPDNDSFVVLEPPPAPLPPPPVLDRCQQIGSENECKQAGCNWTIIYLGTGGEDVWGCTSK